MAWKGSDDIGCEVYAEREPLAGDAFGLSAFVEDLWLLLAGTDQNGMVYSSSYLCCDVSWCESIAIVADNIEGVGIFWVYICIAVL